MHLTGGEVGMATAKKVTAKKATAQKTAAEAGGATREGKAAETNPPTQPAANKVAAKSTATKAVAKKSAASKAASDKYTDPALRDHIKADVMKGDKGGRPGQWSARKAQMVAHEYEAEGGGYKGGRDETQQSLTAWGAEHWKTKDGKPAEQADGMHRYLPEKAWEALSPAEKKATDQKKLAGDHEGKQFVANTASAVKARKRAQK